MLVLNMRAQLRAQLHLLIHAWGKYLELFHFVMPQMQ